MNSYRNSATRFLGGNARRLRHTDFFKQKLFFELALGKNNNRRNFAGHTPDNAGLDKYHGIDGVTVFEALREKLKINGDGSHPWYCSTRPISSKATSFGDLFDDVTPLGPRFVTRACSLPLSSAT